MLRELIMIGFCVSFFSCIAQGKQIRLNEVELVKKALPIIVVDRNQYSFRNRDFFIKTVLKSRFWEKRFYLKMDLSSFSTDSLLSYEIEGKVKAFIDGIELDRNHQFKKKKVIQVLNERIVHVSVSKFSTVLKNESIITACYIQIQTEN